MTRPTVAVVGAGLAGAATAYFLAHDGACDVLLLEREAVAGRHSSGRNAAMVRQVVADPEVAAFARDGARFIRSFAGEESGFWFQRTGGLLVADAAGAARLRAQGEAAATAGVAVELLDADAASALIPALAAAPPALSVLSRADGVVDVANLLQFFLREAVRRGASFRTGVDVAGLRLAQGRVRGIATPDGTIACDAAVDACGAWAGRLLGEASSLTPFRRHLFATGPLRGADRHAPWVWDVSKDVYFRPESGGLLLSPCDEEPAEPGIPEVDPRAAELLDAKLAAAFPALREGLPVARVWAGLRTFAPDRRFRVRADPRAEGLFSAAGLGGHGVTCAAAVGAACASAVGERVAGIPGRRGWLEFFTAGTLARAG